MTSCLSILVHKKLIYLTSTDINCCNVTPLCLPNGIGNAIATFGSIGTLVNICSGLVNPNALRSSKTSSLVTGTYLASKSGLSIVSSPAGAGVGSQSTTEYVVDLPVPFFVIIISLPDRSLPASTRSLIASQIELPASRILIACSS